MTTQADYYATRFTPDPARSGVWREIARYVARDIKDSSTVLELGCGYGDFINSIPSDRKMAIDLHEGIAGGLKPDVQFICGDCTNLDFLKTNSVSTIFASNLLEHLQRDAISRLLSEIRRVLHPKGRLLLIQPNYRLCAKNYFDDYTHVTIFSDTSLCGLLEAEGFAIQRCVPGLLPFSMKSSLPKHPLLVRLYLHAPLRPLARQMYVVAENLKRD